MRSKKVFIQGYTTTKKDGGRKTFYKSYEHISVIRVRSRPERDTGIVMKPSIIRVGKLEA